jgi:hypothetical protein
MAEYKCFLSCILRDWKEWIFKKHFFLDMLFNNPVNCWDYIVYIIHVWNVGMEQWWNGINRRKPKYSGKNLFQCHFDHYKSKVIWLGSELGPPQWQDGNYHLSHGMDSKKNSEKHK